MPVTITLPAPPVRTTGTLIDVASPLESALFDDARQEMAWADGGVKFQPWSFGLPTADEANCAATYLKDADDGLPEWIEQPAFLLWRSLQCSSLSGYLNNLNARIKYSIDDLISASLAAELETGTASGGIGLTGDGTYVPTIVTSAASSLVAGFVALEQHLADTLHGAIGTIHLTASLYALAYASGMIREGRSRTGHYVVGDAGHSGTAAPQGESAAGATESWIYATGLVYYGLSPVKAAMAGVDAETFNFSRNMQRPLQERHGVLIFDPNLTGAALVDIDASTSSAGAGAGGVDGGTP